MIEELCEFLERHGWDRDIADEIHDAYYHRNMDGVEEAAEGYGEDELVEKVKQWQQEVGEAWPK